MSTTQQTITPGLWVVEQNTEEGLHIMAGDVIVCEHVNNPIIACAIAALPDMIEALRVCVATLERCQDNPIYSSPPYRVRCIQQATEALGKAGAL